MKTLFNIITEFIEITGNSLVDNILFWFIEILSFSIAFGIVGRVFDFFGKYDSDLMSDCHWGIRLGVFIGLSFICNKVFKFINWLFSFKWWVYAIFAIVLVLLIVIIYYIKYKLTRKKRVVEVNEQSKIDTSQKQVTIQYNKDNCPRCGAVLVKRHGPYGDFYGCENFSSSNCRYTRKFK